MADHERCPTALRNDDIGWKVEVMVLTTWIPLLFVIAVRVLSRRHYGLKYGIDDYAMVFAAIPISLGSIFHLIAVHNGLGRHVRCLSESQIQTSVKFQYLGEGMNLFSIWVVKLSICFFLLALIEGTHHRKARIVIWVLLGFNTAVNLVSFILWTMLKIPIEALWDTSITPKVNLIDATIPYDQTVFIINAVIDFFFAFSPIYFLWSIQIPRKRKYVLWGLLLLGLLPSVAAIFKVIYLNDIFNEEDPTYVPAKAVDLAALGEQNGGTIIANLPCFGVLFDTIYRAIGRFCRQLTGRRKEEWRPEEASTRSNTVAGSTVQNSTYSMESTESKPFDHTEMESRYDV